MPRSQLMYAALVSSLLLALAVQASAESPAECTLVLTEGSGPCLVEHCAAVDLRGSMTLEAWIRPKAMGREGGRIIDKGTAGTKSGYMLDTFPGNSLRMIVRTEAYEAVVSYAAELAGTRWTHVAGTFDARRGVMALYVNGKQRAAKTFAPNAKVIPNRYPLSIGSDQKGENQFLGQIDRVTVYDRAVSADEIAKLAGDPSRTSLGLAGRVADWDFGKLENRRYLSSAPGTLALRVARTYGATRAKLTGTAPPPPGAGLKVWLREPAREWLAAFPVGNGRLGGMVHGGVRHEHIQLNEDTLWTGGPHCYDNPGALAHLKEVRRLIAAGKYREAHAIADKHMIGLPRSQQSYQTLGDLWVDFDDHDEAADYCRELDMTTAVARVCYRIGEATFTRETFVSHPDQVMVVRLTCDKPGSISALVSLDSPHPSKTALADKRTLRCFGQLGPHAGKGLLGAYSKPGLKFEARVALRTEGGAVAVEQGALTVRKADAVTLVYTAATSYKNYRDISGDPGAICAKHLAAAADKTYQALRTAHVADHSRLFGRVQLDLGGAEAAEVPTDQRIRAVGDGKADPLLIAQSFQFGRYLLIASSRPGTQPANLQGIWAGTNPPPAWGSKWTLNINAEMNYWPAESCNLAECHEPLLRLVERLREPGRRTAKVHYNCRGFVAHHNADLWLGTAPVDGATWGLWPMGGAWLTRHLWEHYDFSRDIRDLKRAYPTLKEAAEFFADYLVEDKDGNLLTSPAISFEQGFRLPDGSGGGRLCMGPTMDMQILRDLFTHTIDASRILGVDEAFRTKLTEMRRKLLPTRINPKTGRLCEWRDFREPDSYGTGQLAALWGLNPGDQITPWSTPKLAAAARKSLEYRQTKYGSWCSGTRINFRARLGDGDALLRYLQGHFRGSVKPSLLSNFGRGFFEIDGNFGLTSGIAEMLLQSHAGQIHFLPALPKAWPTGSVKGLRARGGFDVDLVWKDGLLVEATLRSRQGALCMLRYRGKTVRLETQAGKTYRVGPDLQTR